MDEILKHQQETIEQQRAEIFLLKRILDDIPGSVYWKNKHGIYLGRNLYSAKQMEVAKLEIDPLQDDVIGKTDYDLFSADIADELRKNDLEVMSTGKEMVKEEVFTLPNGETLILLSTKKPLRNQAGELIGVVGNTVDITQLKRAEEREREAFLQAAEERSKADAEVVLRQAVMVFAGSIAHDLRVPLTSIMLTTDLVNNKLIKLINYCQEQFALYHNISNNIEIDLEHIQHFPSKIKKIIVEMNEFISVTLKSIGKLVTNSLNKEDFVLCEAEAILMNVLAQYPFHQDERKLIQIGEINNFSFLGCPILFCRILFNIFNNALQQITANKGGEIYISMENIDEYNVLKIKDTAGGVPPEIIEHLFDGYHSNKKGGTGVGLAFCKLTMQSFGGDISCHSVFGEYIEFVLTFPTVSANEVEQIDSLRA
ncbi:MAG: PAS domain-containing protein [Legionellales bacterium]|nr:PAS domain-containing protein [Legionellales bacterium]